MKWFLDLSKVMKNNGFTPLENLKFEVMAERNRCQNFLTGFTVLEIIIVMGIMLTVTSLVLANYPGFNETLGVRRAAEEIASSVRQAQAYGLGVREFGAGSGKFPGYGLYFQRVDVLGAPSNSYIFFADANGDLQYNAPNEKIEEIFIQGSARIEDLCVNQKQLPAGPCGIASLDIVYLRPQPNVSLRSSIGGSCGLSSQTYCDVEIKIKGSRGTEKTIVLWLGGQASIE